LRALALVVALLWAWIGFASAQQTGTSNPATAAQETGAGGTATPPVSLDQPAAAPAGATAPLAGAASPPAGGAASPSGAQVPPSSPSPSPPAKPATNPPAGEPSIDTQAAELLKKLTARQFDGRLPEIPLADWLAEQIGKRAEVQWTTGDCGDEGGEPEASQGGSTGGGSADVALCSEAQALFYDASGKPALDRYVVLQLRVGNRRLGVTDDPSGFGPDALTIFVFDGSSNRTLFRLGDLPGVLASIN
jgi:hypothetical protein